MPASPVTTTTRGPDPVLAASRDNAVSSQSRSRSGVRSRKRSGAADASTVMLRRSIGVLLARNVTGSRIAGRVGRDHRRVALTNASAY